MESTAAAYRLKKVVIKGATKPGKKTTTETTAW